MNLHAIVHAHLRDCARYRDVNSDTLPQAGDAMQLCSGIEDRDGTRPEGEYRRADRCPAYGCRVGTPHRSDAVDRTAKPPPPPAFHRPPYVLPRQPGREDLPKRDNPVLSHAPTLAGPGPRPPPLWITPVDH